MIIDECWRRAVAFVRRERFAADLEEEMRLHVELRAKANRARGVSPGAGDEAEYAARRRFGNRPVLQQASRDAWGLGSLDAFAQDVRYAARGIRKHALLSLVVVATLTLGLGVGTGVFTFVNAEYLRGRVGKNFDTFAKVYATYTDDRTHAARPGNSTLDDYAAFRDQAKSLRNVAGYADLYASPGGDDPADVRAMLVTANFFSLYDLERPLMGRLLQSEDIASANRVVVLGDWLWRNRFGADAGIVGKTVRFNGQPVTVVGVAPTFAGMVNGAGAWFPYTLAAYLKRGDELTRPSEAAWLNVEARLAPGFSHRDAAAELRLIASRQDRLHAKRATTVTVTNGSPIQVPRFGDDLVWPITVTVGALTIFLLIVCVNVTTLLLSRAAARRQEIAVRLALGISRARLVRMLLTETLLLATIAGAASLVVSYYLPAVLMRWLMFDRAGIGDTWSLAPDWRVFTYLGVVTLAAGTIAGLSPALQSLKLELSEISRGRQSLPSGTTGARLHALLIGAQVALSFVLLFGAVLFARIAGSSSSFDSGIETRRVAWSNIWLIGEGAKPRSWATFYGAVSERLAALPGVQGVAFAYREPFHDTRTTSLRVPGQAARAAGTNWVSASYFGVLGIPIVSGRAIRADDPTCDTGACSVVISQQLARDLWPNASPLGSSLRDGRGRILEVVGIARDASFTRLGQLDGPMVYQPLNLTDYGPANPYVRISGNGAALSRSITSAIKAIAPELYVRSQTIEASIEQLSENVARIRSLIVLLCAIAVGLAVIGIYGVVAFSVSQRTKELGIRLALGATRRDVYRAVLGSTMRPISIGLVAGLSLTLAMTLAGSRVFADAPFALRPHDPLTYVATALGLGMMALAAMLVPARRATRVDPVDVLRYE